MGRVTFAVACSAVWLALLVATRFHPLTVTVGLLAALRVPEGGFTQTAK